MYGYRFVPYGIGDSVSEDDGQTESQEFVIQPMCRAKPGFPSVVTRLPGGRILRV
jgi:hypothetical protein